jgi:aldehyde dehydrogenase (NAD+)
MVPVGPEAVKQYFVDKAASGGKSCGLTHPAAFLDGFGWLCLADIAVREVGMTGDGIWFPSDEVLIGGRWRGTEGGGRIDVVNPSDGTGLCEIARGSAADIDAAVAAAKAARDGDWGRLTAAERGRLLSRLSQLVLDRVEDLARIEALDVGKPLKQARADALALARYMEFYGGAADKLMGETIPYLDGYTVYTLREPHGVTAHIVPWNYPMQILGRSVGAALAAGNACVVKPAEDACLTALALARLAGEAGFPAGALNIVTGLGSEAGAALAAHPGVNHVSFTGSVAVGRMVQEAAARNIVPVTLELGGKSPQIVFADADLDRALPFLVNAGIQNAGQTCSAGSRILVERSRYDEVVERMAVRIAALTAGPALSDLDLGPIISARQKARIEGMLGMAEGLTLAAEGQIAADAPPGGFYLTPRLYAGVRPDHVLAQDEIFGPVQVVIPFEAEEEAIAIANGTDYGLVAGVWTENMGRAMRLAKRVRAGQVFLNNYGAGGGVELPFGGTGKSGHGREKGFEALYGFMTLKTVAAWHG